MLEVGEVGDRDERFDRTVAGAGSVPRQRGVDAVDAVLDSDHGVGHRQREVLVSVDADLGLVVQRISIGTGAVTYVIHRQPAAGVGDVDAMGTVRLHQLRLLGDHLGRRHVVEHQEAGDIHAHLASRRDVLSAHVRLGAVRRDPHRPHPEVVGPLQVVDGADAGEQQRGQAGVLDDRGRGLDPLPVAVGAGTVVDRPAGQTVAVGDLDGVHAGLVGGDDDPLDVLGRDPVAYGVHAVAQRDFLDVDGRRHVSSPSQQRCGRPSAARPRS